MKKKKVLKENCKVKKLNEKIRSKNAYLFRITAKLKNKILFDVKDREEIKSFMMQEKESLISENEKLSNVNKNIKK